MSCSITNWRATTSGSPRLLRVRSEGECTQGGHTLRLLPDNEGIVDDPALIVLRLEVDEPDVGPDVITPAEVTYEMEVDDEVARVEVRLPDGAPVRLKLEADGY